MNDTEYTLYGVRNNSKRVDWSCVQLPHVSIESAGVLMGVQVGGVWVPLFYVIVCQSCNHPQTLVGSPLNEALRRSPQELLLYMSVVLLIHLGP